MVSFTKGISTNLSNIIDATEIAGVDSFTVTDPIYSNGSAIRCVTPNGTLIDTGYLPAGTLAGVVSLQIYHNSNLDYGTENVMDVYVYRLDPITNQETLNGNNGYWNNPHSFNYRDDQSLQTGKVLSGYFDPAYSYRIEIKLNPSVPDGNYLDIDWIQFVNQPTVLPNKSWAGNGTSYYEQYDVNGGYVFIPTRESYILTVHGDSTHSYKTTDLTLKHFYGESNINVTTDSPTIFGYVVDNATSTKNTCTVGISHRDGSTISSGTGVLVYVQIEGRAMIPNF